MSKAVLEVVNLSKSYSLGTYNYQKFFQIIKSFFSKVPLGDRFFAIEDVNFHLKKGEAIAILGKNGFGKSTLCRLLARVTSPDDGIIKINGKVIPILALSFGIQLETSGYENIFFLGSLLGIKKRLIEKKLNSILEFSNLKEFLHTPLKKYSSGMITRLIFSTLIHFPGNIYILDEVLAVSDKNFKKKAVKLILEKVKSGSSVIFISHEEELIRKVCKYGYVFTHKGKLSKRLNIDNAIKLYDKTLKFK
jgi:lipopolysaccharide transport system ATP-binding protein